MATPQGYDFDFIDQLPDDCICEICHLVLRQPVQTKCCGHRFCKDCLVEASKRKPQCPIDRKQLDIQKDVFDDKGAERTVKSLRITCHRRSSGCKWQGELSDVKVHDQKCDYMTVPCTFQCSGCNFKTQRINMEEHLEKKIKDHLVLMSERLSSLQEENASLSEGLSLLRKENKKLMTTLAEIKEQVIPCRNLVWKISNFSKNLKKAIKQTGNKDCIYSIPFHTHRYGYKMRAQLFFNGDRDEDAGHVSIFIEILRGEYDAVLPWPFARKTTITLVDQKENLQQRKNVENTLPLLRDMTNLAPLRRPGTDSNTARGYRKFISHEKLMTENYIVDDSIFVQVEVKEEYTGTE